MKVFVALACLAVCANASLLPAATISTKLISTGHSSSSRSQDAAGNYAFAYDEQHGDGGSSRKESGSGWGPSQVVKGSYTLNVADGRQRVVKYVADGLGFRAAIATNEPGTAAQPAADTSISSPYLPPQQVAPLAVAAPVAIAAPLAAAPLAAAPLGLGLGYNGLAGGALLDGGLGLGLNKGLAVAQVAAVPLATSYASTIDHAAPIAAKVIAAPAIGAWGEGLALGAKGLY